ncbi:MAG TPA: hypothetical protein VK601_05635, partial [Kofleriaceae bacterium]|nr:hypothetical protein [Kofleriaceae bacterium]
MRLSDDPRRAEALYRRWLRAAVEARRAAPARPPGRQTRVTHEDATSGPARRSRELEQLGPGKWTRSLLEVGSEAGAAAARCDLPGY